MDPQIADYGTNPTVVSIIDLTHWLSILLFALAVFLNVLLIYAIFRHSSQHTGNYFKFFQSGLANTNIMVAGIIMLTRPAIHLHGGVFFIGGHLRILPFSFEFCLVLIYGYIAIFVQKTIAMGSMMGFRIWAMSRRLSSLPEYYVYVIPTIAFTLAIPPTAYHMYEIFPDQEAQDICLMKDSRGVCTETIGHAVRRHLAPDSAFLVSPLQLGEWHNYALSVSLCLMLSIMILSMIVVLVGSVWIMKQIIVPAALLQIPMAVGVLGSLLNGKMDLLLMCMPIINSLYTCIDPLVLILSVKSYRRGLCRALHIPLAQSSSVVAPTHDPSRRPTMDHHVEHRASASPVAHEHVYHEVSHI